MDKVENLEYWLAKFDLTCPLFHKKLILSRYHFCPLTQLKTDEKCRDNPKLGIVDNNMYAKYDPNPSILSHDIARKQILGINQGPLTLLK